MHPPISAGSSDPPVRAVRTRRTALLLGLVALAFYAGFIVVQMLRGGG
jgi:hypothetical protein